MRRIPALILICGSIVFGIIQALIIIEQELLIRAPVVHLVQSMMAHAFQAPVTLQPNATIRLVSQRALLHGIAITDPHGNWSLKIGTVEVHYSLWRFLREGVMPVTCILHAATIYSTAYNYRVACAPVFARLLANSMSAQAIISIDRISIRSGTVEIIAPEGTFLSSYAAHIPCGTTRGILRLWTHNGTLRSRTSPRIPQLHGISARYEHDASAQRTTGEVQAIITPQGAPASSARERTVTLTIQKIGTELLAQLRSPQEALQGTAEASTATDTLRGSLHCALAPCAQLYAPAYQECAGDAHITITGKPSDLWNSLCVQTTIHDWCYKAVAGKYAHITTHLNNGAPQFSALIANATDSLAVRLTAQPAANDPSIATGPAAYQIHITNEQPCILPLGYTIAPATCAINLHVQPGTRATATCTATLSPPSPPSSTSPSEQVSGTAAYTFSTGAYTLDARYKEYAGRCAGYYGTARPLTELIGTYCTTPFISLAADTAGMLTGSCEYGAVAHIAKAHGISIPGEGTCVLQGTVGGPQITLALAMHNANIRIPHMYNMVEGCTARLTINPTTRTLTLQDLEVLLHRGKLRVTEMVAQWDAAHRLTFGHIPWTLHETLITWGRDIFAEFSGAGAVQYTPLSGTQITGTIGIDRMHMRSNLFSPEIVQQLISTPQPAVNAPCTPEIAEQPPHTFHWKLNCITRKPLAIKTSFLDAQALCTASLRGTPSAPLIESSFSVLNGAFLFPYKPLFILARARYPMLPSTELTCNIELYKAFQASCEGIQLSFRDNNVTRCLLLS